MIRDPAEIKNSNIWQKAGKNNEQSTSLDKRTIIVLGDQKAGKTSFIKIVKGDFDLESKPTRLIDFYTIKKQSVEFQFYEISSPKFQEMLQFYLKPNTIAFTTIVLNIDLTNTQKLVSRINQKIQSLRVKLKQIINRKNLTQIKSYNQQRSKYYHFIQKNDDIQIIKRFPVHFIIVGCKYDLFEKRQSEQKKWISRCLRYLAHVNQADLFYSSTKNMQVCAELRNIFIEELLGNRSPALSNQRDHTKPIFVLTGQDNVSEMNLPAFNNSGAFNELKILEQQMQSIFPSKKFVQKQQPKHIRFISIGLDSLINKHKKEINNILNEKRKRKTQKNIGSANNLGLTNNFNTTTTNNNFNNTKSKINSASLQNNEPLEQSQQIEEQRKTTKNKKKQSIKKQKQQYMDDEDDYQDD